jgi:hypothetical protein
MKAALEIIIELLKIKRILKLSCKHAKFRYLNFLRMYLPQNIRIYLD